MAFGIKDWHASCCIVVLSAVAIGVFHHQAGKRLMLFEQQLMRLPRGIYRLNIRRIPTSTSQEIL